MRSLYRVAIIFLFSGQIVGQDKKYMDSLRLASQSKVDTVRFKAYSFLSWNLKEKDKTEALRYANLLLKEATASDNKKWIALSLGDLAVIYEYSGDVNKAMEYAEKAVSAARLAGNKRETAGAILNLSIIKSKTNKLAEALELQLEALKIYEELKKNYYIAVTCNALGSSYSNVGNYKVSNAYLHRALDIGKSKQNPFIQAISLGGMADNYKSLNQLHSSLICYKAVKKLFGEIEDYTNYATACNNLGELYFQLGNIQGSKAEYKEAVEVSRKMEDIGGEAMYEANLASVFVMEGKYKEAEGLLLKSLATSKKTGNGEVEMKALKNLINLYTQKKDPVQAEQYFKEYNDMRDTMFSKDMAIRFSEAQTKFDVEKKDLEILKNKAELEANEQERVKKNLVIGLIITLFLATAVSGFFFYRKKQIQQRADLEAERASQKASRAKAIIEAEEKERRRIAQDLHDGVGQLLSAAKLNLSSIESKIEITGPEQLTAFKNAVDLLDDSVREVRTVSHNMMPNTLIKLGLASAVREFITKIQNMPDLKVNLEIVGMNERLEQGKESILYRVIQEVVANIIKHAKASQLSLQLIRHEKELSVIIEDNGVGFDTSKINDFGGIGLKNIISRVEFINGKVHFDSTPGKGTTVVIDVPLI